MTALTNSRKGDIFYDRRKLYNYGSAYNRGSEPLQSQKKKMSGGHSAACDTACG